MVGRGKVSRFVSGSTVVAVLGAMLLPAAPVVAVDDTGMFELDGNIAKDAAGTTPHDWGGLFDATGVRTVAPGTNGLISSVFLHDLAIPDPSFFDANQDLEPVADWDCVPTNNPVDHDDLLHAYAAVVQVPISAPDNAGHTVLYVGSERGSNNGDSYAGFWLLKDAGVGCSSPGGFAGGHTDGDLLVITSFVNGGTEAVAVYRWTGSDATGSPVLLTTGGICAGGGTDNVCAIANTGTITSSWPPTSYPVNTFTEAGIDLTALPGGAGGCFSTILATTRGSGTITAILTDFARGSLETCPRPPLASTATPGGSSVVPGSAQHDVATASAVGSNPVPTGTITFSLCGPSAVTAEGCPTGAGTQVGAPVTLIAGSATSASVSGATTTATGKYCWRADYSPGASSSGVYLPSSHTNATTECFTVAKGSPTLVTQIAVTGSNAPRIGFTTLGDTATLSGFLGSVSGETITFNLYGPFAGAADCIGTPIFTTTGTLSAGGVATTASTFTPSIADGAGTYTWLASYAGSAANDPATHACGQASESATLTAGVPAPLTTTATPGGSAVTPGSAQHDVATASAVGSDPVPTGSITFFLCTPGQTSTDGCPTGGTQVGAPVTLDAGSATSATVSGGTTTAAGEYCWRAEYTPDESSLPYYSSTSHTNATTECFTVAKGSPTLVTQIAVTGSDPGRVGGTTLGDTATLTAFIGSVSGEIVTFNLYGPFPDAVTPVCTGTPVFTTTGALNAGGVATTAATFDPIAAGTYTWQASYAGSAANNPATHACGQASETTTVVAQSPTTTVVSTSPNPSLVGQSVTITATVTSEEAAAGVPTGSVTFRDGATVLGSAPVNASGVAQLSTSSLTAGVHTIGAEYAGDGTHLGSSGSVSHTVNKIATVLVAHPAVVQKFPKQVNLVLSATLTTSSGTPLAGRTVKFLVGDQLVCTAVTDSQGLAVCTTAKKVWVAAVRNKGYTALFEGDAAYLPSTDDAPHVG